MTSTDLVARRIDDWLSSFDAALAIGDIDGAATLFSDTSYWRDVVAFTWNIETFEGSYAIANMLRAVLPGVAPHGWRRDGQPSSDGGVDESYVTFETRLGRCRGHLRLADDKAFTLMTALDELKGHEEPIGARRPTGTAHTAERGKPSWAESRAAEQERLGVTEQPYVLVVGGGQSGLALGARLRMQGVPALIIDKHPHVGDQWRSRYRSLVLHDPVWYDHMPYLPFPESWPIFTPRDKIADWLDCYARIMDLNVWTDTVCESARYDEASGHWEVALRRAGEGVRLQPRHVVFAMGIVGKPILPDFAGAASFTGEQLHSIEYEDGARFAGKRVAVVGTNSSGHDICVNLWESGAAVTMIQRSSTNVIRSSTMLELNLLGPYSQAAEDAGITVEQADLMTLTYPLRWLTTLQQSLTEVIIEKDANFYGALRAAGFGLDFGEDGSGPLFKVLRRGGGHYIDTGGSTLIIDGKIKVKSGTGIARIVPTGLELASGEIVEADALIFATGFGPMQLWVSDIVGREVADRVGPIWGYGSSTTGDPGPWEGELRNMWKPTRQPGLWFTGGNLATSRNFSKYLALQIKAQFEEMDITPYSQFADLSERRDAVPTTPSTHQDSVHAMLEDGR